jgi:phage protein D
MSAEAALSSNEIYASYPIIEIDGQVDDMVQQLLLVMSMSESEHGLTAMELKFFNSATVEGTGNDFAFEYSDNDLLSLGKILKVWTGDHNDPQEIFRGTISGLEFETPENEQPCITVLAEDDLQKARMTRRTRLYPQGTVSSIVESVASGLGLQSNVSGLTEQVDAQLQFNESDLAFLRRLIDRFDADLQIVGSELQVAPRSDISRNELTLEFGSQLTSIRIMADLSHQTTDVTYAGWDVSAGQEFQVQSNANAYLGTGRGRSGAQILSSAFGERHEHLGHMQAQNRAEAQALVNACYSQRARRFVCAEGTAVGNSALRVGSHLTISKVGPRFENTYYVTETCHRYDTAKGYMTHFKAQCAYLGG